MTCFPSWTANAGPPCCDRSQAPARSSSPRSRRLPFHPSSCRAHAFGPCWREKSQPVDKLGNILPRVLRRQPGGGRLLGTQVASAFRTLIGPDPARLCDEVELHSGTLVV